MKSLGDEQLEAARLGWQGLDGDTRLAFRRIDDCRGCIGLLRDAGSRGKVPAWQPAMLEDRVRMFEGRPQLYGTQLEADDEGQVQPHEIEDPGLVDERRRGVGLDPLGARLARAGRVPLPADRARFKREYDQWLRRVGWRQ